MPNVTVNIPHQLTRAEAKRRVEEFVAQFHQQQALPMARLESRWNGDTLDFTMSVAAQSFPGFVRVEDRAIYVEVALPWILAMLANSIQQQIAHEGQKLLERK